MKSTIMYVSTRSINSRARSPASAWQARANFTPIRLRRPNRKTPISSDNGHLFSNLRRHEEISESSGTRHGQSGWVTAIWPPSKAWAASLGDRNRDRNQHLGDLL